MRLLPFPAPAQRAPNALRYEGRPGHVESWFWRANDPDRPRALWLKVTILAPLSGPALAESWFVWFDGEKRRLLGHRTTVPFSEASFGAGAEPRLLAAGFDIETSPIGRARGALRASFGEAAFDLSVAPERSPIAEPLALLRGKALREGPFPRSKLLTPLPAARLSGSVTLPDGPVAIDGWPGMQGHNWGREHAFEYAWGQCLFPRAGGAPEAMLEGFTGRVCVAGRLTPWMSALLVRRGEEELRFDRLLDFWRQRSEVGGERWTLALRGPDGEARLRMEAAGRPTACLGYRNPDGRLSYCFNSKLAEVRLQLQPRRGGAFELYSEHGGALELLRREPGPAAGIEPI